MTDAPELARTGLRAVIESDAISHERLPMLEVVCDRTVRLFATSMRHLVSDAIDVVFEDLTSVRFGDHLAKLDSPVLLGVFRAAEWDGYGLLSVEPALGVALLDALLGGKGGGAPRDGRRGYTGIETTLIGKLIRLALADLSAAFEPVAPVSLGLERIELSSRFAAIAGASNIACLATFRVEMDGRGGCFSVILPYATLEPVRDKLVQRFMGEKLGRDPTWEAHMSAALAQTEVTVEAVLGERAMRLRDVTHLVVGQVLAFGGGPDDPLQLRSGGAPLASGQIGRRGPNVAVSLLSSVSE